MFLRDGSSVADPRLGRLVQFDERSRNYPIRSLLQPSQLATPRSYTWNVGTCLNQGQEGACVGFAITHELIARPVVVSGLDAKFAREQIYWQAQRTDSFPGGEYPGASPQVGGTSVLAGIKVATSLGHYSGYRWAFSEMDLRVSVGYKGPAVIGINWYDGMFDPDTAGFITPSGSIAGGHCILVYGVNVSGGYYKLWNSWGSSWGLGGACKMKFSDMAFLLDDDGEAVIPTRQKS